MNTTDMSSHATGNGTVPDGQAAKPNYDDIYAPLMRVYALLRAHFAGEERKYAAVVERLVSIRCGDGDPAGILVSNLLPPLESHLTLLRREAEVISSLLDLLLDRAGLAEVTEAIARHNRMKLELVESHAEVQRALARQGEWLKAKRAGANP